MKKIVIKLRDWEVKATCDLQREIDRWSLFVTLSLWQTRTVNGGRLILTVRIPAWGEKCQ